MNKGEIFCDSNIILILLTPTHPYIIETYHQLHDAYIVWQTTLMNRDHTLNANNSAT